MTPPDELDLSPYRLDPFGLEYALALRKRLREHGFVRVYRRKVAR